MSDAFGTDIGAMLFAVRPEDPSLLSIFNLVYPAEPMAIAQITQPSPFVAKEFCQRYADVGTEFPQQSNGVVMFTVISSDQTFNRGHQLEILAYV